MGRSNPQSPRRRDKDAFKFKADTPHNGGHGAADVTQDEMDLCDVTEDEMDQGGTGSLDACRRILRDSSGQSTGWSFEREKTEWLDAVRLHVEMTINEHVLNQMRRIKESISLAVLIVSSIITLLTSSAVVKGNSARDEVVETDEHVDINQLLQVTLLGLSFVATILSGYFQLQETTWREQGAACRSYVDGARSLFDFLVEQLSLSLEDRKTYAQFQQEKRERRKPLLDSRNLDISPGQRMQAVRNVRNRDAEAWSLGFEWLGTSMVWPSDPEDIVAMLMEFSREDLGEHTLSRADNKQYRRYADTWKDRKSLYFLENSLGNAKFRQLQKKKQTQKQAVAAKHVLTAVSRMSHMAEHKLDVRTPRSPNRRASE